MLRCISFSCAERRVEGRGSYLRKHYVQFGVPPHLVLRVSLVLLQQFLLRKADTLRHLQLVLQVLLEEHRLARLLVLLMLVRVNGILVEVVLGVEIGPDCKGKHHSLLDPIEEAQPDASTLDVGMQPEEAAQRDAPFDGGDRIRVTKHILALQVVHLLDLQPVALLPTHPHHQTKINRIIFKTRQIDHCTEFEVRQVEPDPFEASILTVYQSYFSRENLLYITFQRFWILASQLIRQASSSFQGLRGSLGASGLWALRSFSSSLSCLFQLRSSTFLRSKAKTISWYLNVSFLQCSRLELASCSRLLFSASGVILDPLEVLGVLASFLPLMPARLRSICGLWHLGTKTSGLKLALLQNYSALQRYSSVLEFITFFRILALEISLKSFGLALFILYQSSYFFIALKFISCYKDVGNEWRGYSKLGLFLVFRKGKDSFY